MKRKLCLVMALVMLFAAAFTSGVAAENAPSSGITVGEGLIKDVNMANLAFYRDYLTQNKDYKNATETVVVDATSFDKQKMVGVKEKEGIEIVPEFEGRKSVIKWTSEEGNLTYKVTVPADGLYALRFAYYCLQSRYNPISLGMAIDGKVLYDGMYAFELPRTFVDDLDEDGNRVRTDGLGNEFAAEQVETFMWQTGYFKDPTGMESKPYLIALTAGEHEITIGSSAEPFALDYFELVPPVEYDSYVEYSKKYNTSAKENAGALITIEGEDADYKSTNSLVAQYDQTDPSVSSAKGSNPYLTRINYIGNTNWSSPGQRLTWKVNVEKSGFYRLAFRHKQSLVLNGNSYRKLMIDGVVPFEEAANIKFEYDLDWNFMEFADSNGKPYYVYLEKGQHELALEVSLGELSSLVRDLKEIMYEVGELYTNIVKITGESPDPNRDYALFEQIPDFLGKLERFSKELNRIASETERLAGQTGGTNATTIRSLTAVMDNMIAYKYTAHQYKSLYYTNYTSVSALVYSMMEMGLNIDYMQLAAEDVTLNDPAAGWWESTVYSFERFLSSFSSDYNNVAGDLQTEDTITIWANWGRDQIRVLNNLIQSSFTPETGIGVNLKMSNASYVHAILSGNGPDCSLHMARSEPVNLALRGAMIDLKKFNYYNPETKEYTDEYTGDFDKVVKDHFMGIEDGANPNANALLPFTFDNDSTDDIPAGVYALPDTLNFYMMFYRTDIFDEYGIEPPSADKLWSWDDFLNAASIFYRNNLQASLPYTQITTANMVNNGVGSLSILPTLIMQKGGRIYKSDGSATNLKSSTSIQAFEFWTDFFNEYKFPVTADFFNRFRVGTMPMGVQNYTMYIQLTMAAPEITGKWKMVPIPGFEDENGKINNVQAGSGTGCGILRISDNPEAGWEFLKWWTKAETQLAYSNNCESILGVSGRVPTGNPEALKKMGWDKESLNNLISQWKMIEEVDEIPGSYYTARSIDQAYWNVVNNNKNAKDMLIKWADISDREIERKRKQYNVK